MTDHRIHKTTQKEGVDQVGFKFAPFCDGTGNDGSGRPSKNVLEEPTDVIFSPIQEE
jgi:hypothetical protein